MYENATQGAVGSFVPMRGRGRGSTTSQADLPRETVDENPPTRSARAGAAVFLAVVAMVLRVGRHATDTGHLTPESGLGYALGVAGLCMMVLLLLYSVRKRWGAMQRWGAVRHWFRVHMMLGVLGPVCIALHCGMRPGAVNSKIALIAMMLVVASGVIGRYIYAKIHHGLYGSRATLVELSLELAASRSRLVEDALLTSDLRERLLHMGECVDSHPKDVFVGGAQVLWISLRSRLLGGEMLLRLLVTNRFAPSGIFAATRPARVRAREYLASVRNLAGFAFYERLFSLWHMLHVPLFLLLMIASVVHVVAVHRY